MAKTLLFARAALSDRIERLFGGQGIAGIGMECCCSCVYHSEENVRIFAPRTVADRKFRINSYSQLVERLIDRLWLGEVDLISFGVAASCDRLREYLDAAYRMAHETIDLMPRPVRHRPCLL